jgi:ferredoxin
MGEQGTHHGRVDRRAFVGLVGQSAVLFAFGGLIRRRDPKRRFLRPPGAAPEEQFLSLCNRCQKCVEECPTIIVPVTLAESIAGVGTPKMLFSCGRCMRCAYACPTGALLPSRR